VSGPRSIAERFRAARRDPALAVLEGFHPLKHALRFGAEIVEGICVDRGELRDLCARLAPDVAQILERIDLADVDEATYGAAAPRPPRPVLAIARRPDPPLPFPPGAPLVVLDRPTHHGNLGAVVRVAAAAGAGGVLSLEGADPWHPSALRGGAGLQFAVAAAKGAVAGLDALAAGRPRVAVVPGGEPGSGPLPRRSMLLFGSERQGLRAELLDAADRTLGIPIRAGVSSLNQATAVAVALYGEWS
jgi:TrmH family RNA methyltransferase